MIWSREQYLSLMSYGEFPRPMFVELFGPLIGLEQEWRAQGASDDEISLEAFDFDYVPVVSAGGHTGAIVPPAVTISEDDELLIQRDGFGRTMQLCKKTATIALPMDFPVRNMDDWQRVKPAFTWREERIDWRRVGEAKDKQAHGTLVVAHMPGVFSTLRDLMGEEIACMACYEQPELLHDVIATMQDTTLRTLEPITDKLTIDQLSVHEDFAGKSGPLFGPAQIEEFFQPYYRAIWGAMRQRGTKIFQQDTDGNVNPVIEQLLACGLTNIYPMEPAAGMDVVQVRKQYGRRVNMLGGIDKHVLRQDKAAIRRELEYKLQPLMREGGMVFGLDHRIPNGTPLANYRYYVDTAREMLGIEARNGRRGWRRMAF